MIAGSFRALVFQAKDGFQASYDTGYTWRPICGPPSTFDIRFYLRDNCLYAADSIGGLWLNTNALGRGVPVFYDAPMKFVAGCDASINRFPFNFSDPCVGAATLDSVTALGSARFSYDLGTMPREVSDLDSFGVRYPAGGGSDTARLTFHFTFQGVTHDTTVTVVAQSSTALPALSLADRVVVSKSCQPVSSWIRLLADSCSVSTTLDSISVSGSPRFLAATALPRDLASTDSISIEYLAANADRKDTALVTLHFSIAGVRHDTTITVYGESRDVLPVTVDLTSASGSQVISLLAGSEDEAIVRLASDVAESVALRAITCTLSLPQDAVSKSGTARGVNGWQVTREIESNGVLTLELTRTTNAALVKGDVIARIPIEAFVALDTVANIILTDYSFNSEFTGCTPESITPDTVTITVTGGCGDSTIRHYMRAGVPFVIESITPNPATNRLNVDVRRNESGSIAYEIVGLDGTVVAAAAELATPIDTRALRTGVYYLRLEQAGFVVTKRFEIAR